MANPVVKLLDPYQKDAKETLEEAIEMDFETVVIIGIGRDKTVNFRKSANANMLQVLGSVEAVKMHIWEKWE